MPLLEPSDLEKFSPMLRGRGGRALGRTLMKMLGVGDFCRVYDAHESLSGPEFCRSCLRDMGVRVEVNFGGGFEPLYGGGEENLRSRLASTLPSGPFVTVSNHPYGGLDGMVLADLVGHARSDFKIMVNKILGLLRTMEDTFITVTPTLSERTAPTAESLSGIRACMSQLAGGHPLGLFPSGAVSDLRLRRDGLCTTTKGLPWLASHVRDRGWQEAAGRLIGKAGVPVVPIRFFDCNSAWYYSLGLVSWKLRLLRLPREVINKGGKLLRVGVGPVIPAEELKGKKAAEICDLLRHAVYGMELSF